MRDWYETHVYPQYTAQELPLECLQLDGELMYVPENWWHATLQPYTEASPVLSISVAAQMQTSQTKVGKLWIDIHRHAASGPHMLNAVPLLEELIALDPDNADAWYNLGHLLQIFRLQFGVQGAADPELLLRELQALNQSVFLSNERSCDLLNDLASVLIEIGDDREASRLLGTCIELCGGFEASTYCFYNKGIADENLGATQEHVKELEAKSAALQELQRPKLVNIGHSQIKL